MKIEELMNEWAVDSKIDLGNLAYESTKIDSLKQKYLDHFMKERLLLRQLKEKQKKLYRNLYRYYSGDIRVDECRNTLGREPPNDFYSGKEMIVMNLEIDDDYVRLNSNIGLQEEKLSYLTEVVKSLNDRGYKIKNTIDFLRFRNGEIN